MDHSKLPTTGLPSVLPAGTRTVDDVISIGTSRLDENSEWYRGGWPVGIAAIRADLIDWSSAPVPAHPTETFFFAPTRDAESWSGPHDSLEEAIDVARAEYAGERETFWVDTAQSVDWGDVFRRFVDADRVVEELADFICDNENVEEPEPEFVHGKDAAQKALEAWLLDHVKMSAYWQCDGSPKEFGVKP